jgi:hypothetical protein
MNGFRLPRKPGRVGKEVKKTLCRARAVIMADARVTSGRRRVTALRAVSPGDRHDPLSDLEEGIRRSAARAQLTNEAQGAWEALLAKLREVLHEDTVAIWFDPLELVGELDGRLYACGDRRLVRWIWRRYREVLDAFVELSTDYEAIQLVPREVES